MCLLTRRSVFPPSGTALPIISPRPTGTDPTQAALEAPKVCPPGMAVPGYSPVLRDGMICKLGRRLSPSGDNLTFSDRLPPPRIT
jgi:hypothetical protein